MSIIDAGFLIGEAREKPLHVGGLQLLRPPSEAGPDHPGEHYRAALAQDEVGPLFRRRAVRSVGGLGPWEWADDPHLDLEYHVRHSALPHPGGIRELLALVSRLHGTLLDRNRPLWEVHVIEGLADGRFATYTKVHHALLDGVSAMRRLAGSLSPDPAERAAATAVWAPRPRGVERSSPPSPLEPVAGFARGVGAGGQAVGEAGAAAVRALLATLTDRISSLPYQAPRSMLNVPITGARRFAADSWDLDRVRAAGRSAGGSVNDVVLAMCAGALRAYLLEQDALPEHPLVAAVPVSLRTDPDPDGGPPGDDQGNAVGVVLCDLATHLATPEARFARIHSSMRDTKAQLEGLSPLAILLLSGLSFGPVAFGPLFRFPPLRKPPFNLVISNVPGPPEPLYDAGSRLEGLYPASVPYDGQALNITVTSYAGSLEVGITGCRRSVPHLQRLLAHLETSLDELEHLPRRGPG